MISDKVYGDAKCSNVGEKLEAFAKDLSDKAGTIKSIALVKKWKPKVILNDGVETE